MEINDYIKNNELVPFNVIEESNEPIGAKFWSTYHRDYPFVIVNDVLLKGKNGQSHAQVLQSYLKSFNKDKSREKAEELANSISNSVCFGHIKDEIAFIDSYENCSLQNIVNILRNKSITKVYITERKGNEFINERIAKEVI